MSNSAFNSVWIKNVQATNSLPIDQYLSAPAQPGLYMIGLQTSSNVFCIVYVGMSTESMRIRLSVHYGNMIDTSSTSAMRTFYTKYQANEGGWLNNLGATIRFMTFPAALPPGIEYLYLWPTISNMYFPVNTTMNGHSAAFPNPGNYQNKWTTLGYWQAAVNAISTNLNTAQVNAINYFQQIWHQGASVQSPADEVAKLKAQGKWEGVVMPEPPVFDNIATTVKYWQPIPEYEQSPELKKLMHKFAKLSTGITPDRHMEKPRTKTQIVNKTTFVQPVTKISSSLLKMAVAKISGPFIQLELAKDKVVRPLAKHVAIHPQTEFVGTSNVAHSAVANEEVHFLYAKDKAGQQSTWVCNNDTTTDYYVSFTNSAKKSGQQYQAIVLPRAISTKSCQYLDITSQFIEFSNGEVALVPIQSGSKTVVSHSVVNNILPTDVYKLHTSAAGQVTFTWKISNNVIVGCDLCSTINATVDAKVVLISPTSSCVPFEFDLSATDETVTTPFPATLDGPITTAIIVVTSTNTSPEFVQCLIESAIEQHKAVQILFSM